MTRALTAIGGTVAGIALLLTAKNQLAHTVPDIRAVPAVGQVVSTAPETPGIARTVVGGTAHTKYGPIQLRVTLDGPRIIAIESLQLPDGSEHTRRISRTAPPKLTRDALAIQNAQVHMISGATYTSKGYAASLQSALDAAGINRP